MKRGPKSLFFRIEEPTEEQLMAEVDEFYFSLMRSLRNPTLEDFIAATKIFFAPVIRKALERTKAENRSIRQANSKRHGTSKSKKGAALDMATSVLQERRDLRLPRRMSQLADVVSKRLKQQGIIAKPNTVRHWLTESLKK
jgi:hypothetical protein